jgi:phosphoribosylformimino-5-aminoimidazole carboxamide ribotide isomerase
MIIFPAIDLSEGQVVRLRQGDMAQKTVFNSDPVAQAQLWEKQGAEALHIVDLDGAFARRPSPNIPVVQRIVESVGIPCEFGGGLRTFGRVFAVLNLGVRWAIMGTAALRNREELSKAVHAILGDRIIVGIDARDGKVATEGWTEQSTIDAYEFAKEMESIGVKRLIFTDIATDGMMRGPNVTAMRKMRETVSIPVIASGGVSTLADVVALREAGMFGCIIGRGLYDGSISLPDAIREGKAHA